MNSEYKQEFSYARIYPFKNYSNLGKKSIIFDSDDLELDHVDPFDDRTLPKTLLVKPEQFVVSAVINNDSTPNIKTLNLFRKNSRHFFYTTTPNSKSIHYGIKGQPEIEREVIKLVSAKKITTNSKFDNFETIKDKQIKRHYNNPFSSIEIFKTERWIKREANIVTIKQYNISKTRNVNSKYFRKTSTSTTIKIDMVKGNFLVVIFESRRKNKSFFSNSFGSLEHALLSILKAGTFSLTNGSKYYKDFIEIFDDRQFKDAISDTLMINNMGYDSYVKDFITYWMVKFAELKGIKLPNDGLKLMRSYYPSERYLKKNDRKLVAAILDRVGILSKVTVKILHNHPNTDLRQLMLLCLLLGDNFSKHIGSINDVFFKRITASPFDEPGSGFRRLLIEAKNYKNRDLSKTEIENLVHIINDSTAQTSPVFGIIEQFYDHFNMIEELRQYYPDLSLSVKTKDNFMTEHTRLSVLQRSVKKGYSTHLLYEKQVIDEIEEPIEFVVANERPLAYLPDLKDQREYERMYMNFVPSFTKYIFYPKLLKTSEEYSDEGGYMHHCVAGYIGNPDSMIVSLRCGTVDRVTCEYSTSTHGRRCKQARYFTNENPPDYYKKALEILDERIKRIPFNINPTEIIKVPLMINGKAIVPKVEEDLFADFMNYAPVININRDPPRRWPNY